MWVRGALDADERIPAIRSLREEVGLIAGEVDIRVPGIRIFIQAPPHDVFNGRD